MHEPFFKRQTRKAQQSRKRYFSPEALASMKGHINAQWEAEPKDSPRVKPTLPKLRFLEQPEGPR